MDTEHKPQEMQAALEHLQLVIDAADLGTWELELATGTSVSRSARHDQMFGYTEPQAHWSQAAAEQHVLQQDRPVLRKAFSQALTTGRLSVQVRVRWPDSSIHWVASRGRALYDMAGQPVRMVGVVADVTSCRVGQDVSCEHQTSCATDFAGFANAAEQQSSIKQARAVLQETAPTPAAAAQNELQWRLMAEVTPQILWVVDASGRTEFFNQQWADYTGVPYEPTTAAEVAAAFLHPDDAAPTMEAFDAARQSGGVFRVEHRIRSASGEYRWFQARANPYRDPETGEIVRWFGASVDIHDRRTAEAALRQSEAHFRAIVDLVPDLLWSNEPGGHVDWYNKRWREYTGLDPSGSTGQGWAATIHPDDLPETQAVWQRALAEPRPVMHEHRIHRHDGQYRWHLLRVEPVLDGQGRVVRWFGSATDIHEQRTARDLLEQQVRQRTAELQTLNEREKAIVASARIAVISTDLEGRITSFNPAAEAMFRSTAQQVLGRLVTDFCEPEELTYKAQFFPPDVQAEGSRMPAALIAGLLPERARPGEGPRNEWTYVRDDGSSFPALLHLSVLRDAQGQAMGFLVLLTDLTERKALEEQLRERTRQAEVASAAKTAFLANTSHEIRTPMNVILGLTHLMLRDTHDPLQQQRLDQVQEAARHLLQVLNDILDLSKIEAGKMVLEDSEFDLDKLLGRSLAMVRSLAADKGLEFSLDTHDLLGRLSGDPTRLSQALLNLLSNAVKFTTSGSVTLRGRLLCEEAQRLLLRFEVQDTGPGIPLERQQAVFEAFEQVDGSTTRRHGGTGLGLALVRHLAALMGGEVGLHSVPGEGSTFWFTAWLGRARQSGQQAAAAAGSANEELSREEAEALLRSRHSGQRVLLVEDHFVNQAVASAVLRAASLEVETADNGRNALEMVSTKSYDLGPIPVGRLRATRQDRRPDEAWRYTKTCASITSLVK